MPHTHREDYFHVVDDLRRRIEELEAARTYPPQDALPDSPKVGELVVQIAPELNDAATIKIYDGSDWLEAGAQPGFQMFLNAQVVNHYATGAFTKVPLDTFQQLGGFDISCLGASLATDNFTVQTGQEGWWLFSGSAFTNTSCADGTISTLSLFVNNVDFKRMGTRLIQGAAGAIVISASVPVKLAIGDVADIRFSHNAGAARNADAGSALTYFHGVRISA